jgi:type VI secretion system (T6SS) phospholipase Tle1-like effector
MKCRIASTGSCDDRVIESPAQTRDYLTGIGTEYEEQPDGGLPPSAFRRVLKRVLSHMPAPVLRRLAGGFGLGSKGRITRAYRLLSNKYDLGDHIYLFGFSRGALAARSLAGFVDAVGLLLKDAADDDVERAYALYEERKDPEASDLKHLLRGITGSSEPDREGGTQLPIYFIGVWDTVAALGLPGPFGGLTARWTRHHQTELPFNITHARHALALHELRTTFPPLLWQRPHPLNPRQKLKQVWFAGAHADVGGGYSDDPRLASAALEWMAKEAEDTGLALKPPDPLRPFANPEPLLHHEVRGVFALMPPATRKLLRNWHALDPQTVETFSVHPSALTRFSADRAPRYPYFWLVDCQLRRIDRLALQLRFVLKYRSIGDPAGSTMPRWLQNIRLEEVAGSLGRTPTFIETLAEPSEQEREAFARDLCVWFLCSDDDVLSEVERRFTDAITMLRREYLHPDRDKLDVVGQWLERGRAIAEAVAKAAPDLPASSQARATALADKLDALYRKLNGETVGMTVELLHKRRE